MKHLKKQKNSKKIKQKKRLKILTVLLLITIAGAAITIYRDYMARPGFLEKVWVSDRGADYITLSWEKVRNVNKYVITYGGKTLEVKGRKSSVKIEGLAEDTEYEFSVRADSREREGFEALTATAKTKKAAHITGEESLVKFANRPVDLKQSAETHITYLPGNGYSVSAEGVVTFTRPGEITVTAKTDETADYASETKEITVNVLDTVDIESAGAAPHIFYKLNKDNCKCVMTINGSDGAVYPQSFTYIDKKYIVSFIRKGDGLQRIITYGDKRSVFEPKTDLGHANGLAIAEGLCYSVRGGGSTRCVTFDQSNGNYGEIEMKYGASGIAYDQSTSLFCTSSRNGLVVYDKDFSELNNIKAITRKSTYYVQDCGAYGGIGMHCVSGEDPQGTNYIDFYDLRSGRYIGSAECELNEVESLVVDDEGYIELLSIGENHKNYIWKTPINMKELCE